MRWLFNVQALLDLRGFPPPTYDRIMRRLIYVPFDQLHLDYGALKTADPDHDLIALVESNRMTTGRNWHPARLHFLISSARHVVHRLQAAGFTVDYRKAPTIIAGLESIQSDHGQLPVI